MQEREGGRERIFMNRTKYNYINQAPNNTLNNTPLNISRYPLLYRGVGSDLGWSHGEFCLVISLALMHTTCAWVLSPSA